MTPPVQAPFFLRGRLNPASQCAAANCLTHSSLVLPSGIRRAPDLTGHQIGGFLFSFLTTPAAVVVLSVRHDGVMFRPSWNF